MFFFYFQFIVKKKDTTTKMEDNTQLVNVDGLRPSQAQAPETSIKKTKSKSRKRALSPGKLSYNTAKKEKSSPKKFDAFQVSGCLALDERVSLATFI